MLCSAQSYINNCMKRRAFILLAILGIATIALYGWALSLGDLRARTYLFEYVFFALFGVYLLSVGVVLFLKPRDKRTVVVIVGVAAVIRLVMVFSPPTLSDDIFQYAWDGRVQVAGVNPYRYASDAPELEHLRDDEVYAKIFFRQHTVYPPAAEMLFAVAAAPKRETVFLIKLLLSMIDVGSIALVMLILRRLKMDPARAVLYAWAPLVVFEISHSGHIDGLMVFFVLAAVLARLKRWNIAAGAALGLAVATKVLPLLLLPALVKKRDWRLPAGLIGALVVVFLPYAGFAAQLARVIGGISGNLRFNAGLKHFLELAVGRSATFDTVYAVAAAAILGGVAVYLVAANDASDAAVMRHAFVMAALFVVLLPFLPPWYLMIVLPFLAWRPSPAFLYLSGAVMLSYLFYATVPWQYPEWIRYAQYLPFFGLLAAEAGFSLGYKAKS